MLLVCVYGRGGRQDLWGHLQVVQSSWSTHSPEAPSAGCAEVPATPASPAPSSHQLPPPHRKGPSGRIGAEDTASSRGGVWEACTLSMASPRTLGSLL